MAIVITSGVTLSTAAGAKTADLVTGTYQFVGKGTVTLAARGSVIGMNATVMVGGIALVNDQAIPYFGATGALSINDHIVCSQQTNGGRVEFYLRNSAGGAVTTDYVLLFQP